VPRPSSAAFARIAGLWEIHGMEAEACCFVGFSLAHAYRILHVLKPVAAGDGGGGYFGADKLTRRSFTSCPPPNPHALPRAPHSQGHDRPVSRRGNVHPLEVRGAVVTGGVQDFLLRVVVVGRSTDINPDWSTVRCAPFVDMIRGVGGVCPCVAAVAVCHTAHASGTLFSIGTECWARLLPCDLSMRRHTRSIALLGSGRCPPDYPFSLRTTFCEENRAMRCDPADSTKLWRKPNKQQPRGS